MKIVANTKLIKRNALIGKAAGYISFGSIAIFIYVFITVSNQVPTQSQFYWTIASVLLALIFSQVSMYFTDRWGRKPRVDEMVDRSLKGLGRDYTIYHYVTPAAHLLVGPAGIWALVTYNQAGTITYERKRWRQRGGGFVQGYLRLFGQGNIGRPDLEADSEITLTRRHLERQLNGKQVTIQPALVFLHPQAKIDVGTETPIPAFTPKEIKEFMRRTAKEKPIAPDIIDAVRALLPAPQREEE
jgi:hypothetical protein